MDQKYEDTDLNFEETDQQIEIFKVLHDTLFAGEFIFQPGVKEKLNFYNFIRCFVK